MGDISTITLTIMSPTEIVWQGSVLSLSGTNSEGIFDVLPDHARFMTLVDACTLSVHETNGSERSFNYEKSVLFFQDNVAKIYLHQAV